MNKPDLALDNLQWLICHKTKQIQINSIMMKLVEAGLKYPIHLTTKSQLIFNFLFFI